MLTKTKRHINFDWISVLLYLVLLVFGYFNIVSASHTGDITSYFDTSQLYGKHLIYIAISFFLIIVIFALDTKFFARFSSIIYLGAIILLLGLFLFGKEVNGARSWYAIGNFTIQPSEFAKFATALAVANFITDIQTNIKILQDQIKALLIICIPALLILLQNDAGSTVVYLAFFFVLFREGIQKIYVITLISVMFIALMTLKFKILISSLIIIIIAFSLYYFNRKKRNAVAITFIAIIGSIFIAFSTNFVFHNVLRTHQQNRIGLWLRLVKDEEKLNEMKKAEAYNLIQSEEAISSGGFDGKGYLQGTRTTGKFVPAQHTDYIFTTVGEEWGFLGSSLVVILFVLLIIRIFYLAEKQKSPFSRVYGYGVGSLIFIHFTINIGMVMGLIPTIGISLPFFSYGGSGLLAFTILLFIFIKLDSNRVNEW